MPRVVHSVSWARWGIAVAAARRVVGASPELDFTFVAGGGVEFDIVLADIPRARVASVTGTNAFVCAAPDLSQVNPGIYSDGAIDNVSPPGPVSSLAVATT